MFPPQAALEVAEHILDICPPKIRQNICEYAEKNVISDIYIGELSVNKLLKVWKGTCPFYVAISAMHIYQEGGCLFPEDATRYGAPWYDSNQKA